MEELCKNRCDDSLENYSKSKRNYEEEMKYLSFCIMEQHFPLCFLYEIFLLLLVPTIYLSLPIIIWINKHLATHYTFLFFSVIY